LGELRTTTKEGNQKKGPPRGKGEMFPKQTKKNNMKKGKR